MSLKGLFTHKLQIACVLSFIKNSFSNLCLWSSDDVYHTIACVNVSLTTNGSSMSQGTFSEVDLFVKLACFVKRRNNIFNIKNRSSELVNTRRSNVHSLPLQKGSFVWAYQECLAKRTIRRCNIWRFSSLGNRRESGTDQRSWKMGNNSFFIIIAMEWNYSSYVNLVNKQNHSFNPNPSHLWRYDIQHNDTKHNNEK
jgi:hypothetical protein